MLCCVHAVLCFQVLTSLNAKLCDGVYVFALDRYATHVARRMMCVAAGRNVNPEKKGGARGEEGKVRLLFTSYIE